MIDWAFVAGLAIAFGIGVLMLVLTIALTNGGPGNPGNPNY